MRHDDNFNGNGLYNLRNETFRRFLSEYREWFFTKVSGDTAFDTNMIRLETRETGQSDAFTRRLQASRAIRNCDLMSLAKCERRSIQTRGMMLPRGCSSS